MALTDLSSLKAQGLLTVIETANALNCSEAASAKYPDMPLQEAVLRYVILKKIGENTQAGKSFEQYVNRHSTAALRVAVAWKQISPYLKDPISGLEDVLRQKKTPDTLVKMLHEFEQIHKNNQAILGKEWTPTPPSDFTYYANNY